MRSEPPCPECGVCPDVMISQNIWKMVRNQSQEIYLNPDNVLFAFPKFKVQASLKFRYPQNPHFTSYAESHVIVYTLISSKSHSFYQHSANWTRLRSSPPIRGQNPGHVITLYQQEVGDGQVRTGGQFALIFFPPNSSNPIHPRNPG